MRHSSVPSTHHSLIGNPRQSQPLSHSCCSILALLTSYLGVKTQSSAPRPSTRRLGSTDFHSASLLVRPSSQLAPPLSREAYLTDLLPRLTAHTLLLPLSFSTSSHPPHLSRPSSSPSSSASSRTCLSASTAISSRIERSCRARSCTSTTRRCVLVRHLSC